MKTIQVSEETYEAIKDQLEEDVNGVDIDTYRGFVGHKLFIRTVTYHLVGQVKKVVGNFFELSEASWVADSGRFMQAIADGTLNEVEPIKSPVWVNINSVTDMCIWKHALPTKQQ